MMSVDLLSEVSNRITVGPLISSSIVQKITFNLHFLPFVANSCDARGRINHKNHKNHNTSGAFQKNVS